MTVESLVKIRKSCWISVFNSIKINRPYVWSGDHNIPASGFLGILTRNIHVWSQYVCGKIARTLRTNIHVGLLTILSTVTRSVSINHVNETTTHILRATTTLCNKHDVRVIQPGLWTNRRRVWSSDSEVLNRESRGPEPQPQDWHIKFSQIRRETSEAVSASSLLLCGFLQLQL